MADQNTLNAGWSVWRIALVLYPFGSGAMALNVFFASLIGSWLGWPVLGLWPSLIIGAVFGLPATYWFARHIKVLMHKADKIEG
ncbi:MAG: NnrT protein [Rhodobacteraceae bacterium]|nr:NnrT protein [Paracoccaceae bacterium]